jgi:hypothetical protein
MFTLISLYGMWMRWCEFFLANHSPLLGLYRLCHARQLNSTYGGAHDSDAAGKKVGGVAFFYCCHQPDQQRESVPTACGHVTVTPSIITYM